MQQRDVKRPYRGAGVAGGGAASEEDELSLAEGEAGLPISQIYLNRSHLLLDQLQRLLGERVSAGF